MRILFTKSKLPFSKLICWLLEEPVSHVGIEFDDVVIHSYFDGLRVENIKKFTKHRKIVYSIKVKFENEAEVYESLIGKYNSSFYDYGAFIYLGWRAFLRKFFSIPFPKKNKFNIKGALMCVELAAILAKYKEEELITPYQLYKRLSK